MSNAKVNFDLPTGIENLDITVNFTSKIYPVVVIDAYTASGEVRRARFWNALQDAYGSSGEPTSVELRTILTILRSITLVPDDAYASTGEPTALELKTILRSIVQAPEAYASTGEPTSLLLESKLVSHEQPPDAYTSAGAVTSLELTS